MNRKNNRRITSKPKEINKGKNLKLGLKNKTALVIILVAAIIGLFVSFKLSHIHYKVRVDTSYTSFCAINEGVNCDTVALSKYSTFFKVPLSTWGIFGYFLFIIFSLIAIKTKRKSGWPAGIILFLAIFSIGVSAYLFYLSTFVINSLCLLCATLYIVNITLLISIIVFLKKLNLPFKTAIEIDFEHFFRNKFSAWSLIVVGFIFVLGTISIHNKIYPKSIEPAPPKLKDLDYTRSDKDLSNGTDSEGHPWIGAESAKIEIIEYSDYECPYCSKAHFVIRNFLRQYPDKIKLTHKNFPLDNACNPMIKNPFHKSACNAAKAGYCAMRQGKFWDYNDLLFYNRHNHTTKDLTTFAKKVKMSTKEFEQCMQDDEIAEKLSMDIDAGIKKGVQATPTLFIQGTKYEGFVPPNKLKPIIERLLKN